MHHTAFHNVCIFDFINKIEKKNSIHSQLLIPHGSHLMFERFEGRKKPQLAYT